MSDHRLDDVPPGPILIVADNGAIAVGGPRWAKVLEAAGRRYRVRLAAPSSPEAIAAEARSLGAVAVVWVGGDQVRSLAETAVTDIDVPVFNAAVLKDASTS